MRRREFSTLAFSVMMSVAPAFAGDLSVATSISWNSAAQPILHVLAFNEGKIDRPLNAIVPDVIRCDGKKVKPKSEHYRRFLDITNWHSPSTDGLAKARGWFHRSFPLSLEAPLDGTCEATFRVTDKDSGETLGMGTVEIPSELPKRRGSTLDRISVSAEVLIEEDRDYDGLYVIRVLARNTGAEGILLYEEDRSGECAGDSKLGWPMTGGVLQGEDSGPIWTPAGEWAVFVNVARYEGSSDRRSCEVELRLSALHEDGVRREVARVSGPLLSKGYVKRPWRHTR